MEFLTWFRTWFTHHPINTPAPYDPTQYTAAVMERIRAAEQPARRPALVSSWLSWPRLSLAVATAAAGLLVIVSSVRQSHNRLAQAILQGSALLAAVNDANVDPAINGDVDVLTEELETLDTMMLAQSPPSDERWVEQTLELLDQVGEDESSANDSADLTNEEEWVDELRQLDENELSVSS